TPTDDPAPVPGPSYGSSIATLQPYQIEKNGSGSRQIPKYKSCKRPTGPGTLHDDSTHKILIGIQAVLDVPVSCTLHATFNQCRGMVFSKELLRYSEEKLLKELRFQEVVKVDSSKAHPASSSECGWFRMEKEILKICTILGIPMHRFCPDTRLGELFLRHCPENSAPTPESMPPILSPQTSLVVAEVCMDDAGISATPHLSSTCHPGATNVAAKLYPGSLKVDDHPSKVTSESKCKSQTLQQKSAKAGVFSSEMPTDPVLEVYGDETTAKIEPAAGILHLGSHLQVLTLVRVHRMMGLQLSRLWPHSHRRIFQLWSGTERPSPPTSCPPSTLDRGTGGGARRGTPPVHPPGSNTQTKPKHLKQCWVPMIIPFPENIWLFILPEVQNRCLMNTVTFVSDKRGVPYSPLSIKATACKIHLQ
ncbi:hypothetical protein Hamer_G010938, partial [Homarus americanus]